MRLIGAISFILLNAAAQPVSIGLKAGVPVTGDLDSYWATSESKRVTFGPAAVFRLPRGWSIEFDALYRRVGYRYDSNFFSLSYTYARATGNSWQFPILLRKSLWRGVFVGAGYAPQIVNGGQDVTSVQATTIDAESYAIYRDHILGDWQTSQGIVAAAGVEKRVARVRLAPEVRYIRWTTPALDVSGSRGFFIGSQRNEVELMLTVRFP